MNDNNPEDRMKAIERQQKTILENQEYIMDFLRQDVKDFQNSIKRTINILGNLLVLYIVYRFLIR